MKMGEILSRRSWLYWSMTLGFMVSGFWNLGVALVFTDSLNTLIASANMLYLIYIASQEKYLYGA